MKPDILKFIYDKFDQVIPEHLIKSIINKVILQMKLVTREEFDVQKQVLIKTRTKLEMLEKKVCELEIKAKNHS